MVNSLIIIVIILLTGFTLHIWWLNQRFNQFKIKLQQSLLEQMTATRQQQMQQRPEMQNAMLERIADLKSSQERRISELSHQLSEKLNSSNESLHDGLIKHREAFAARRLESLKIQQENLTQGMGEMRKPLTEALIQNGNDLGKKVDALTCSIGERLKEICGQVDKRLNDIAGKYVISGETSDGAFNTEASSRSVKRFVSVSDKNE